MTNKLFYQDAYLRTFEADIVEAGHEQDGTPYVILDQTAFYPTGGGQPCDLGTLAGIAVVDVEEVDGQIHHRLAAAIPNTHQHIQGEIDWQRRFDHMQQHTGQHILSAAFETLYDAETFGFHLGRETVTVDIAKFPISADEILAVEELSNNIVFENRPVSASFVTEEELARLPLRKAPSVAENIRIVAVEGFDYSPCGGTHPRQTGEVGFIKVLAWEKYKTGTRVEFVCGNRAIAAMENKQQILRNLGRLFGTGENELAGSAEKLLNDRKELEKELQEIRMKLMELEAKELVDEARKIEGIRLCIKTFENRPMQELQRLAGLITSSSSSRIALLAGSGTKTNLVFAKSPDVSFSMVDILKSVLPLIDGKGGGNASIAQGGGNAIGDPGYLLEEALRLIKEQL